MIVLLSAWAGSGKDTVANYMAEKHGFKRVAFADPLKDEVADQFKLDRTSLDDQSRKELPILSMPVDPKDAFSLMIAKFMVKEFRNEDARKPEGYVVSAFSTKFMGHFTEGGSSLEQLYWTPRALAILEGSAKRSADGNFWVKKALSEMDPNGLYVISDLRYKNEVSSVKNLSTHNVINVRIDRFDSTPSADPSENDLNDYNFDFRLNNKNVSLEDLFRQVDDLLTPRDTLSSGAI